MDHSKYTDQELQALFREGDVAAYTEIYHRYKGVLHIHAYKKLGNFEEAKDVVQELFSTLWEKRTSIPQAANFSGYLYQMMRNRILSMISHKEVSSRYFATIGAFMEEGLAVTDHLVRERDLAARIENEINKLPLRMREVFVLSRKYHLSHKEIAEQLDISPDTVKNHVKGALKILRGRLGLFTYVMAVLFLKDF